MMATSELSVLAGRQGRTFKILRHRAGTRGALDVMDAQAGGGAERYHRHSDTGTGFGPDLDGNAAPPELAHSWSQLVDLDGDMSRAATSFRRSDACRNQKGDIPAFQDCRTLGLILVTPLFHPAERQAFADHLAGRIEVVNFDAAVIETYALEEQFAVIDPANDIFDLAGVSYDRRPEPLDELRVETGLAGSLQASREDLIHARWLHDSATSRIGIDAVELSSHSLKPFDGAGFGHGAAMARISIGSSRIRVLRSNSPFSIVSSNSPAGSESAMIAPPAPMEAWPSLSTTVRITMLRSTAPSSEK
jgi:hypothetical protein